MLTQTAGEFEKAELFQSSEKAWGTAAHYVKTVARERGWPNSSHRDVRSNADRLIPVTDDPRQNERLFEVVENLHLSFYEDTYAENPDRVRNGIEDAGTLIGALEAAEARRGQP